jgi:hypothetical protein
MRAGSLRAKSLEMRPPNPRAWAEAAILDKTLAVGGVTRETLSAMARGQSIQGTVLRSDTLPAVSERAAIPAPSEDIPDLRGLDLRHPSLTNPIDQISTQRPLFQLEAADQPENKRQRPLKDVAKDAMRHFGHTVKDQLTNVAQRVFKHGREH